MTTNTVTTKTSRKAGVAKSSKTDTTTLLGLVLPVSSVAVAGSSISDGTAFGGAAGAYSGVIKLTGADGTKGAILPTATAGSWFVVRNPDGTNAGKVYPKTSAGVVNNGSAGAALSIPANTACIIVNLDGNDNWFSVPRVPS